MGDGAASSGGNIGVIAAPRILVIQTNGFGDALMTVALFRLLRAAMPMAHITVLVSAPEVGAMLREAGLIDDVRLLPHVLSRPGKLATYRRLRTERYGIAIVATMFSWHHVVAARWIAGIPRVISDSGGLLARLSATTVRGQPRAHRFLANGALMRALVPALTDADIRSTVSTIDVAPPSSQAAALIARLRAAGRPLLGLHLGSASQPVKRVPSSLAIDTLREVRRRAPEATVLYLQGTPDPPHASLPEPLRAGTVPVAGLAVNDLLQVLRACDAVLTGDTGIAHLAAAAGTKAVVAAGPTDIDRTRPWGDRHVVVTAPERPPCMPCYGSPIYDNDACPRGRVCLAAIRPADLAAALLDRPSDQL